MHYVYYFFCQRVACESEDIPNAFIVSDEAFRDMTLRDFFRLLPFPQRENCLFRFKSQDSLCGYIWEDISDFKTVLPCCENQIFAKILCTDKITVSKRSKLARKKSIETDSHTPLTTPNLTPTNSNHSPTNDTLMFHEDAEVKSASVGYIPTFGEFADIDDDSSPHTNNNNSLFHDDDDGVKPSKSPTSQAAAAAPNNNKVAMDSYCLVPNTNNFKNIRTLLSTLHTVLHLFLNSNSGANITSSWKPIALDMLLTPGQVKSAYRRSLLIVHPDKHAKGDGEIYLAGRIFEALNVSYKDFVEKEGV